MSLSKVYFTPRWWERSGRVYTYLGIRFFKKWLPTNGDRVMRARGSKTIQHSGLEAIISYERITRQMELIHLISFLITLLPTALIVLSPSSGIVWILLVGIVVMGNIIVNLYPIMLQRYNRARVYKILERRNSVGILKY